MAHPEPHLSGRAGWLRAAVLGANDGILSVAALIVGVAAGGADRLDILLAGIAGTVAGALSMAAGEYVSVSSQADVEAADIAREKAELERNPQAELDELAAIYRYRGLSPGLAQKVAEELSAKDALGAHLRDEIGLTDLAPPQPVQAAIVSATTFAAGAAGPLLVASVVPAGGLQISVGVATIAALVALGAL
ncbi:VIT family protein, partial [Rhodobacterales bacterium HKCCE3408]|nr:VIT family protein [Rhodobacterales bacterium HKCCE3408]